jgi:NADH-quinone oxidoreductase subunit N
LFYTTVYAIRSSAHQVVALVRRETRRRFSHFSTVVPFPAARRVHGDLHAIAGWHAPAGWIFGKFYLFSAALRAGANHGLLWLVALALFGSLISLYYYLIVLKVIFVGEATTGISEIKPDWLQRISLAVLAMVVLFLGLMPEPLVTRILASLP